MNRGQDVKTALSSDRPTCSALYWHAAPRMHVFIISSVDIFLLIKRMHAVVTLSV